MRKLDSFSGLKALLGSVEEGSGRLTPEEASELKELCELYGRISEIDQNRAMIARIKELEDREGLLVRRIEGEEKMRRAAEEEKNETEGRMKEMEESLEKLKLESSAKIDELASEINFLQSKLSEITRTNEQVKGTALALEARADRGSALRAELIAQATLAKTSAEAEKSAARTQQEELETALDAREEELKSLRIAVARHSIETRKLKEEIRGFKQNCKCDAIVSESLKRDLASLREEFERFEAAARLRHREDAELVFALIEAKEGAKPEGLDAKIREFRERETLFGPRGSEALPGDLREFELFDQSGIAPIQNEVPQISTKSIEFCLPETIEKIKSNSTNVAKTKSQILDELKKELKPQTNPSTLQTAHSSTHRPLTLSAPPRGEDTALSPDHFAFLVSEVERYLSSEKNPSGLQLGQSASQTLLNSFAKTDRKTLGKSIRILLKFIIPYVVYVESKATLFYRERGIFYVKCENLASEIAYLKRNFGEKTVKLINERERQGETPAGPRVAEDGGAEPQKSDGILTKFVGFFRL